MGKTESWKDEMKYHLAERIEQQAEINMRRRMIELAAGSQGIELPKFWIYPTEIRVKNRKEAKEIMTVRNRNFDTRFRFKKRNLSKGIC